MINIYSSTNTHMLYGLVPNTCPEHDPVMSLPHPMRPGWLRHCHGGTLERRRRSGGHHASRRERGEEMG